LKKEHSLANKIAEPEFPSKGLKGLVEVVRFARRVHRESSYSSSISGSELLNLQSTSSGTKGTWAEKIEGASRAPHEFRVTEGSENPFQVIPSTKVGAMRRRVVVELRSPVSLTMVPSMDAERTR